MSEEDVGEGFPPQRIIPEDKHPELFSDLEPGKQIDEALFSLWQKDIVVAEWDPEAEATCWALSEFATEMYDEQGKDSVAAYLQATEDPDAEPAGVRVIGDE